MKSRILTSCQTVYMTNVFATGNAVANFYV